MYAHVSINCPIFALFEIFKVFAMCNICRLCYMLLLQHILVSHLMLLLLLADSKVKLLCEYFMFLHLTSGCILKTHSIESTLHYFLIETTKSWRNFNSSKSHHWNFMLEERGTGKSEGSFLIGNVFLIVSSDDGHHLPCFWCWFSLLSSRFPFFYLFSYFVLPTFLDHPVETFNLEGLEARNLSLKLILNPFSLLFCFFFR